jgi:HEAT repeat protein
MNKFRHNLIHLSIIALLAASPLAAWMGINVSWNPADPEEGGRSSAYREAQRALNNEDWEEAEALFTQVAEGGGSDTDAALYWKAYVQFKRERASLARQTLLQLEREFPQSSWIDDARALEVEARQASGQDLNPADEDDEDLKLYALNALMHTNAERALPVLEEFLQGDHSLELKERALFVLSQSDSPRAQEILTSIAKGHQNPELAMKAIEYLGLHGGAETGQTLQEVYASAKDAGVKAKVLEGLLLGNHEQAVLAVARGESNPELRAKAVEMLGVMDARAELEELYRTETSAEVKAKILEGLFIAGDAKKLAEVARTESDPELRRKAIEGLGLVDSKESQQALESLYESETDRTTRMKILESFFLMNDAETLAGVARQEQDPELKAKAIEGLGLIGTASSRSALSSLYAEEGDPRFKKEILEAFMLQNNHQALIDVIRSEEDRELRKQALEYLSMIDSDEAMDFLLTALED